MVTDIAIKREKTISADSKHKSKRPILLHLDSGLPFMNFIFFQEILSV